MHGTIKFYNQEKGFGVITESEKKEYFFYINKVLNAPEKIDPNDKVEFIGFETPRGLNAKDITFKVKINCHVCNSINADDDEKCGNPKCGFTLKYAKGYSANISDKEASQYKKELEKAKKKFEPVGIMNDSKRGTSNILNGKIISYNDIEGEGLIRGSDALKYSFIIEDTDFPLEVEVGKHIEFCKDGISLIAKNIVIKDNIILEKDTTSSEKKRQPTIKINDETIFLSQITSYKLDIKFNSIQQPHYGEDYDEHIRSYHSYVDISDACYDEFYHQNQIDRCICEKQIIDKVYFTKDYHTNKIIFNKEVFLKALNIYKDSIVINYFIIIKYSNGKSQSFNMGYFGLSKYINIYNKSEIIDITGCPSFIINIPTVANDLAEINKKYEKSNAVYKKANEVILELDSLI